MENRNTFVVFFSRKIFLNLFFNIVLFTKTMAASDYDEFVTLGAHEGCLLTVSNNKNLDNNVKVKEQPPNTTLTSTSGSSEKKRPLAMRRTGEILCHDQRRTVKIVDHVERPVAGVANGLHRPFTSVFERTVCWTDDGLAIFVYREQKRTVFVAFKAELWFVDEDRSPYVPHRVLEIRVSYGACIFRRDGKGPVSCDHKSHIETAKLRFVRRPVQVTLRGFSDDGEYMSVPCLKKLLRMCIHMCGVKNNKGMVQVAPPKV